MLSKRPHALGFTLVEILVTIAIISLLVGILLPGMVAARREARRTACQAQLRQVASAWIAYLDDHGGHFFQGINAKVTYGGRQGGAVPFKGPRPLNPYLGLPLEERHGAQVFRCPSDIGGGGVETSYFEHYGNSYFANPMLVGYSQVQVDPSDPCQALMQQVNEHLEHMRRWKITASDPKLVLVGDAGWLNTWEYRNPHRIEWHDEPCTHNMAFMDTHVEFLLVRRGVHVHQDYQVVPFKELEAEGLACQEEESCE